MLQCVIIDDEPLAIQLLADYVDQTAGLMLLHTFSNPIEAIHFLQEQPADLLFLDVQMPELTGIQVMKILNQRFPIILTTAYEQYALDGYDHHVVDYLLKPIPYDRFYQAVQKATTNNQSLEPQQAATSSSYLFVKTEYRLQRIDHADIAYLEGQGDYVAIHTSAGRIMTLENMKHFEQVLPATSFCAHSPFLYRIYSQN